MPRTSLSERSISAKEVAYSATTSISRISSDWIACWLHYHAARLRMTIGEKVAVFIGVGSVLVVVGGLGWTLRSTEVPQGTDSAKPRATASAPAPHVNAKARAAAEAALRSETKVKDVLWSNSILYVGVL